MRREGEARTTSDLLLSAAQRESGGGVILKYPGSSGLIKSSARQQAIIRAPLARSINRNGTSRPAETCDPGEGGK